MRLDCFSARLRFQQKKVNKCSCLEHVLYPELMNIPEWYTPLRRWVGIDGRFGSLLKNSSRKIDVKMTCAFHHNVHISKERKLCGSGRSNTASLSLWSTFLCRFISCLYSSMEFDIFSFPDSLHFLYFLCSYGNGYIYSIYLCYPLISFNI